MDGPFGFLLTGIALGAPAGLAPGPLQALVLSETLRYGRRRGAEVSLAPLITDAPIALISVYLFGRLADSLQAVGIVSLAGAAFLLVLAWRTFNAAPPSLDVVPVSAASLKKGVLVNLLSPHPYLFWFLVGAPTIVRAWHSCPACPVLFLAGFYLLLLGVFLMIALCTAAFRSCIRGRGYTTVMRGIGVCLAVFAVLFLKRGIELISAAGQ